jgi:flagellar basal body-associated protein FliL
VIAVATSATQLERAMRRRRIAKIVLAILLAVFWIPVAIVMLVAGTSDRRR